MSHGIVGVEFDGSIAPDLLDEDDGLILGIADSNVTTAMGSIVIGAPFGEPGVRPYVVAGAGLIRFRVSDADDIFDIDENSFGVNVGGGMHVFVADNIGIRADLRYFRGLRDEDTGDDVDLELGSFDFWRASVGAAFRFQVRYDASRFQGGTQMRPQLLQIAFAGALGLVAACSPEERPEAADRPPAADAAAKPDAGDRTAAATETADVKLAISMDKTVDASDINVDTDPATKIVTLKGTVASAEQKARAEAIAVREATGFRVVNDLVVKRKAD